MCIVRHSTEEESNYRKYEGWFVMTLLLKSENVVEPKQPEVVMKRCKSTCKDQKPIPTDLQLLNNGDKMELMMLDGRTMDSYSVVGARRRSEDMQPNVAANEGRRR